MPEVKCVCGYEPKSKDEFDMLETWGCAKARITPQGFGRSVTLCSREDAAAEEAENLQVDPNTVQENYKNMIENNKLKPNGPKK